MPELDQAARNRRFVMSAAPTELIVARCGLVCSNCGAFRRDRCGGCHSDKPMFSRCPVKACAVEKGCSTCAACESFPDLRACGKLNNFIARIFGFIFRSDRIGSLYRIREIGLDAFKAERHANRRK
jgi:hypothetical protein